MTTKKLRFPFLLLALWLIAETIIPQSYAAGSMHSGAIKNGTGDTSGAVSVNVRKTTTVKNVPSMLVDGY